jgi:hypothetical protein
MADRWMIRGLEYSNCNCNVGCPCQFNSPSTHGHCEAIAAGTIEEGSFNETRLDGLRWSLFAKWPGEIAEGKGRLRVVVDERADAKQRAALVKILQGESTKPGGTHFAVFRSTMSEVLDPLFAPIDLSIDMEARRARLRIPNLAESDGSPIVDPFSGNEHRARIELPNGFEFTRAEVGKGTTRVQGPIELRYEDSHAHINVLHVNQDGVIR